MNQNPVSNCFLWLFGFSQKDCVEREIESVFSSFPPLALILLVKFINLQFSKYNSVMSGGVEGFQLKIEWFQLEEGSSLGNWNVFRAKRNCQLKIWISFKIFKSRYRIKAQTEYKCFLSLSRYLCLSKKSPDYVLQSKPFKSHTTYKYSDWRRVSRRSVITFRV